jgi:AcrR family transcriptional regulator
MASIIHQLIDEVIPVAPPRSDTKRQQLVLAAYERLASAGFEGLRTRDVAAAVGDNVATLHYYFPTKEALIRAVIGHAMSRFASTLSADGSPAEQLRGHFAGLRKLLVEEPELMAVLGELAVRSARDPALAAVLRQSDEAWHSWLLRLLEPAAAAGVLPRGGNPDEVAALVMATLRGLYLLPAESRVPDRAEQALRELERALGIG